jgi:hypothetical protein
MSQDSDKSSYFAAREAQDTANVLLAKGETFFNTLRSNAYLKKITDMWLYYYGQFNTGMEESHTVSFTGEEGELVRLPVNLFRNLARHIYNMITSNRPILEARAINSDYRSLSQTYLANGILDYYMREKGMEDIIYEAVEMSVVLGAAYVEMEWNATAGDLYDFDPDTGAPIYEGEIEFRIYNPLDVVVDGTKERWDNEWYLVRTFENRYNLIAKYPEYAEKLKGIQSKTAMSNYKLSLFSNDDTDDIPVYKFYHKRTEALPEGRYMLFASPEVVLLDIPLPYRDVPLFRLSPSSIMGTPYAYTDLFDVFPLQEALNSLYSTVMTNQTAFGVQNVYVPRGADLTLAALEGGLNVVEGNAKPEPINLTQTPAEIFNFISQLTQVAETQVGVNSVTRGTPEASLRSGNALALVQSMSLQFNSSFQRNYVKFLESMGTNLIEILKDFAQTPKLVSLVGTNKRPLLKEFTGDQIKDIKRVIVDVGNPLSRSVAGRVEMAQQLAQMQLIKNPNQYFMVLETGRLDSMTEGDMSDLLLIKRENEWLLEGKEVIADPLDIHQMHIMEHRAVINDPELRFNPELSSLVRRHIQEHIDMMRTVDPDLLQVIGVQPLNPPAQASQPGLPPGPQAPEQAAPQGGPQQIPNAENSNMNQVMDASQLGGQATPENQLPGQPSVPKELLANPELEPRAT